MPFKKKMTRKQWSIYFLILALAVILLLTAYLCTSDTRKFRKLSGELFVSELSGDTLSLHYTLAYPQKYHIDEAPMLPSYGAPSKQDASYIQSLLDELSEISPDHLNEKDAFAYGLLVRYLTCQLSGTAFPYYGEPLSPSSGIQSSFPILLADYTFRCEKDVEDYLHLLDQFDTCFGQLIQYEQEKAKRGLFMSDQAAAQIVKQCTSIMDADSLSSGTHFLHTTFQERLMPLIKNGSIDQAKANQWISENDRLLTTVVAPAYEKLADAIFVLSGNGQEAKGLCHFPQGQSYYEYLLASTTGTDRSISEIRQMLYQDFRENYTALICLLSKHPDLTSFSKNADESFPFHTPGEMLADLQTRMQQDFPPFPGSSSEFTPVCTIKKVSSSMEEYSSPAYYLTPPIDDLETNIIYINHKNEPDPLSLYTTLAHEGYPGHLYQTVYSQLYFNEQNVSPIRNILHYGSYVEGWAFYVENMSYFYAQSLAKDQPSKAAWYEACRLNRNLQLCVYSLLDLAIHHEGLTLMQAQKILMKIGITSPQAASAIYEYIVEEPVNYLKYYLGFLEFQSLKAKAKELWGNQYSDKAFHQFVLETGPSDFQGLREKLYADTESTANVLLSVHMISLSHICTPAINSADSSDRCINAQHSPSLWR